MDEGKREAQGERPSVSSARQGTQPPKRPLSVRRATRTRARRYALQALYQWQVTRDPPKEIERQFWHEHGLAGADTSFFTELFRGTTAQCRQIDRLLEAFTDRPVAAVDPIERAVLRLATYELLHHPKTPARVIINEAVELTKIFGGTPVSYRYVNAVLDRLAKRLRRSEERSQDQNGSGGL